MFKTAYQGLRSMNIHENQYKTVGTPLMMRSNQKKDPERDQSFDMVSVNEQIRKYFEEGCTNNDQTPSPSQPNFDEELLKS